jgi:hypothetical protein
VILSNGVKGPISVPAVAGESGVFWGYTGRVACFREKRAANGYSYL